MSLRFVLLLTLSLARSLGGSTPEALAKEFAEPPIERRLRAWWFWTPPYLSPDGMKKDVEAMFEAGMGGVNLMTHSPTSGIPKGFVQGKDQILIRSESYNALVKSVIDDLAGRGMKFDTHNVEFYKGAAGPWVTLDQGMRMIRVEHWHVTGPRKLSAPWPASPAGKSAWKDAAEWKKGWFLGLGINTPPVPPGDRSTLREIALLAVPGKVNPPDQVQINGDFFNDRDFKKATALLGREGTVPLEKIQHLTNSLAADGTVTWDVPPGEWTLLRFMSEPTGHKSAGMEVDKWDKELLVDTFNKQIGAIIEQNQEQIGKTFQFVVQDSWESSIQTWSANMPQVFHERRGYDLTRWLPVLAGVAVNSREESERFLWDMRRTIADQFVLVGWIKVLRDWCNERGLGLALEGRVIPCVNYTEWWGMADKPMDESWFTKLVPRKELVAAVADYHGRNTVGMEAHTDLSNLYMEHPGNLKPTADSYFCAGWNQLIPHCYTAQPFDEKPGYRLYGIFNNRSNTWWNQARPYFLTIGRIQSVLQQLNGVADILVVEDETPILSHLKTKSLDELPVGFLYDACDAYELEKLKVENGQAVSPLGKRYSAVFYWVTPEPIAGSVGRIRPEILAQLFRLVEGGVQVVTNSPKPTGSPSLDGYPETTAKAQELADKLWDSGKIGKPADVAKGLTPDIEGHGGLNWTHRRNEHLDAYFLANHQGESVRGEVTFRIAGMQPQLWHPESATIEPILVWREENGRTIIPLNFEPFESYFVVFAKTGEAHPQWHRQEGTGRLMVEGGKPIWVTPEAGSLTLADAAGKTITMNAIAPPPALELSTPWELTYPAGQGTPEKLTLPKLQNMITHENKLVRGFSGTVTYRTSFTLPVIYVSPDLRLLLDLGDVQQLATVRLNGKELGAAYRHPYVMDITSALHEGENQLEIAVTNTWLNRMVTQKDLPETERVGDPSAWLNDKQIEGMKGYAALKDQGYLMDSGLIGPVRLRAERLVEVP